MSTPRNGRSTRSIDGSGPAPRRLDDYELVEEIGRGATGQVFRAIELTSGREVALKVLDPSLASDREAAGRFRHEAQAATRLEHPGIVQAYRQGEAAGTLYFAMQLVRGTSLAEILFDRVRLPPERVLSMAVQAADALAHAHRAGVTHRDVKPANLIIDCDGRCMIADFGVALAAAQTRLTRSGESLGSPHYMAPEAIRGEEPDGRTDLYSLGIVLFEALTGEKPYPGKSFMAVLRAHLAEPLPHIRELDPDLPEELDRIVARLMAKDREERYQTAEELARDLRRAAGDRTDGRVADSKQSASSPEQRAGEAGPGSSARRLAWGLTLVVLAAAAGAYLVSTRPWESSEPPDPPLPSEPVEAAAASAPPATAQSEPEEPAPPPPPGVLVVASDYPVTMRLGGRTVELDPSSAPLEVAPGKYELHVEAPSVFYRGRHPIEIRSGERTRLRLPATTTVTVAASPSRCRVRLDGHDLGFVPLTLDVALGQHRFEFEWRHLGLASSIEREVTAETERVFAAADP